MITLQNSGMLAAWLAQQAEAVFATYPALDPKGIGRKAPATPLDVERLVLSGALTTRDAP